MSSDEVQEQREKAEAIVERAVKDADFRRKLVDDPEGTLRTEGLREEVIPEFIREQELGDVAGYRYGDCTFTCNISSCTNTRLSAL
jgi:hypothetical protein